MADSKKGFFFAAALVEKAKTFKKGLAEKAEEKRLKKCFKTFGRLKTSLTFAAALRKSKTGSKEVAGKKEKAGKKLKNVLKTFGQLKTSLTFAAAFNKSKNVQNMMKKGVKKN